MPLSLSLSPLLSRSILAVVVCLFLYLFKAGQLKAEWRVGEGKLPRKGSDTTEPALSNEVLLVHIAFIWCIHVKGQIVPRNLIIALSSLGCRTVQGPALQRFILKLHHNVTGLGVPQTGKPPEGKEALTLPFTNLLYI